MSENPSRTCVSECYLLPSWWCHPCGMELLPTGCYAGGNLALAECSPLPSFGSHQTSKIRRHWTGRFCHCGPKWRQLPPCPPAAHFSSSCPSQRGVEGTPSLPQCLWRPSSETLNRGRNMWLFFKNCIYKTVQPSSKVTEVVHLFNNNSHIPSYVHVKCFSSRKFHGLPSYLCLSEIFEFGFQFWIQIWTLSLTNKKDNATVTFPLIYCINFVCFMWKAHPEVLDLSWFIGHQWTISLGSPKLCTLIKKKDVLL